MTIGTSGIGRNVDSVFLYRERKGGRAFTCPKTPNGEQGNTNGLMEAIVNKGIHQVVNTGSGDKCPGLGYMSVHHYKVNNGTLPFPIQMVNSYTRQDDWIM